MNEWKSKLDVERDAVKPSYPVFRDLPIGCYCQPGRCMAPRIMGRQMPCRDIEKANHKDEPVSGQN